MDQRLVDERLLLRIQPDDCLGDFGVDVLDGLADAFAEVAGFIAISQFDGLACPGGSPGRHRSPPHDARFEQDVAFDGGIPPRIENLTGNDINN